MKSIISISLGASRGDYDLRTHLVGHDYRVRRFGTDGNIGRAEQLVTRWRAEADVIGLDLTAALPGRGPAPDPATVQLMAAAGRTPATTGALLRTLSDEWALRGMQREHRGCFNNARVLFLSGLGDQASVRILSESTRNLTFADPLLQLGIPKLLTSTQALQLYAAGASRVRQWMPTGRLTRRGVRVAWNRYLLRKALQRSHVVVGPLGQLEQHTLEELGGKIVVTTAVTEPALAHLRDQGVDMVVDRAPPLLQPGVEMDVLDALIVAALGKPPSEISSDDYLRFLEGRHLAPRVLFPSGKPRRVNRFAFVIHPLTQAHLRRVKSLDFASRVVPKRFSSALERIVAYSPPFVYSRVSGIRSPQGVEAEGWLITLGGTPKQLLAHDPEFTYRRLLAAARMAERLGAQIMGLGAFTKVVGDAGVTVAKRATIPITTGNSYSASGALWAAQDAARRMGLLTISPDGKVGGKAMVVG
ncbi:MAG: dehydrogenase, partial [Deltaproteobacteria bacterium]|nr:dehydrogenase [Deltaproteobacteria bacterium]